MPSFLKEKFFLKHQVATLLSVFAPKEQTPQHRSLMYHSVYSSGSATRDIYALPVEKLALQMRFLQKSEWQFVPFSSDFEVGKKQISITFDDGCKDNLLLAYPVLKELKIPFTIFMISDFTQEKPDYLNAKDLVELVQDPLITIGAHGKTHRPLASLPFEEAKEELRDSKSALESILGQEVNVMSFPHGSFNQGLLQEAARIG